jgi:hypothetical protein
MNGIKELADSIAAHELLQNLQVRKAAAGKFEVVAGGRRHAALKLLAKKKALAKEAPIACNLLDDEDAAEISLAENEMRQAMHPADQFEACKALIDFGHGIETPPRGSASRRPLSGNGSSWRPSAHADGALPQGLDVSRPANGVHRVGRHAAQVI